METTNESYERTGRALYINYFIHGIQIVVLAQGVNFFAIRWNVNVSTVFSVIAAIGIGKILVMLFSGVLSDIFGRKPFVMAGIIGYIFFFGGLLFCTDVRLAYVLAALSGGATSLLDGGTYPALLEIYPQRASSASVLVKGFIASATGLVPIAAAFLMASRHSFNWIVLIGFILSVMSFIIMWPKKFPLLALTVAEQSQTKTLTTKKQPAFMIDGVLCLLFGFLCLGTFYLWQQAIGKFAVDIIKMNEFAARGLSTVSSLSTIISVVFTTWLMKKKVKDITILVVYTFISVVGLGTACAFPITPVLYLTSAIVGFCMAGGLLQLGGALLSQFFPNAKGRNTSLYNVSFSFGTYIIPLITKALLEHDQFDKFLVVGFVFAGLSCLVATVLLQRYQRYFLLEPTKKLNVKNS